MLIRLDRASLVWRANSNTSGKLLKNPSLRLAGTHVHISAEWKKKIYCQVTLTQV